jgi:hypothetical protein
MSQVKGNVGIPTIVYIFKACCSIVKEVVGLINFVGGWF